MVCDLDRRYDAEDATVAVVEKGKNNLSKKLLGDAVCGDSSCDVCNADVVGVELWGDAMDIVRKSRVRRRRHSAPPFVCDGTTGEDDQVPGIGIVDGLEIGSVFTVSAKIYTADVEMMRTLLAYA